MSELDELRARVAALEAAVRGVDTDQTEWLEGQFDDAGAAAEMAQAALKGLQKAMLDSEEN